MSSQEALRRLGLPVLTCSYCQEKFVIRTQIHIIHIYVDGELGEASDAFFCQADCAKLWAEDYNASTDRNYDPVDRHAVPGWADIEASTATLLRALLSDGDGDEEPGTQ